MLLLQNKGVYMSVKFRRYKLLVDFDRVNRYLADVYNMETLNGYLLPQYFEYAHTHTLFNYKLAHRFGLWEDENDLKKINDCLWFGFDHGPEPDPDNDIDDRMLMQSAPNFRKDLTTVIKAPNDEYACFAGMWIDNQNNYAYLEPLATVPKYRRMGLAAVAVVEGMKKTKKLGQNTVLGEPEGFIKAWVLTLSRTVNYGKRNGKEKRKNTKKEYGI
jgi:hypothetical protein